ETGPPRRANTTEALVPSGGRPMPSTSTKSTPRAARLRSRYDREILRLALPALATLAVEPLYILVDTAIVGHLGTPQIAGRGIADLRTPLLVVFWGNVANLALELVLVYGLGLGMAGSAAGTAVAQAGMGAVFVARLLRGAARRRPQPAAIRRLARVGGQILV